MLMIRILHPEDRLCCQHSLAPPLMKCSYPERVVTPAIYLVRRTHLRSMYSTRINWAVTTPARTRISRRWRVHRSLSTELLLIGPARTDPMSIFPDSYAEVTRRFSEGILDYQWITLAFSDCTD